MKKILLILLLSFATVANAGLKYAVNGVVDPPDSTVIITPSDHLLISVVDDGQTGPGSLAMGIYMGPGSLDASNMIVSPGASADMVDDALKAEELGIQNPFIKLDITDSMIGIPLNDIDFHCEGEGDVTLLLVDWFTGEVFDTQVIHQVPEPMTVSILCLGALFLRRRIA